MPPRKFTNPKDFFIWDDCKTVFIYGFTSPKTTSRIPTTVYIRISEDYKWAKKGTKWMEFFKSKGDEGYRVEGFRSTADMKTHAKVMLEKGAAVVCSEQPALFKSVSVR